MSTAATTSLSTTAASPFLAIFWGGLACGVLDITQACIAWGIQNHLPPVRIFQSVASGLLGPKSFQGGAKTAALGLFLHFLIAFIWALIYYVASRQIGFLTVKPVIAGLLYGEFVWVMMNCVVVPLWPSIAGRPEPIPRRLLLGRSCIQSWWDCRLRWR
jgi:uncharacterized membrane protein YagU involved in acid resistance